MLGAIISLSYLLQVLRAVRIIKNKNFIPYLMLIGAPLLWSTNFILGKYLVAVPPVFIGAARVFVAVLIFLPLLLKSKTRLPKGKLLWQVVFMGITGVFLFTPLVYLGLHYTTSINATIINSLTPLSVTLLGHFWLKEELTKAKITGLTLSILGVVLIAVQGDFSRLLTLQFNPGDIIIFIASIMWAIYTILVRLSSKNLTGVQSTGFAMIVGLIFLAPAAAVENIWAPVPDLSLSTILIIIYLGIFPSVVAFLLWNTAVARVGASQAGMFANLIPIFNIVLASQFLHEQLYAYHIIGFLIIFAGLLIATKTIPLTRRSHSIGK